MIDPANDSDLLARFAATGSQEAFAQVVSRHIDLVHSAAMRQVRDVHLAEDVAQSVFMILARKAPEFGPGIIVGAWLLNATWYVSRDLLKREARRLKHERKRAEMTPTSQEAHDPADWDQLAPVLDDALAGLTDADRQVIVVKYFEGRSDAESASILGVSENTLRQRRFRGLQRMRAFFHRRGITLTGELLAGQLMTNAVIPAPPGLSLSISQNAVAAVNGAAAASAVAWLKGAMLMGWLKTNAVMATVIILLLLAGTGLMASSYLSRHQPTTILLKPDDPAGPRPRVPAGFVVGQVIPARAYAEKRGCQDFEFGEGYLDTGSWLCYRHLDFGNGSPGITAVQFAVCIAVPASNEGGEIRAHLDSPTGPVISKLTIVSTGGWGKTAIQSAPVESVTGVHDVYLTFWGSGVGNLFWAQFRQRLQTPASSDGPGQMLQRLVTRLAAGPTTHPVAPATRPNGKAEQGQTP